MQGVGAGDRVVFPYDGEDVALAGIDGHFPVLFPFFKLFHVLFMEDAGVSLGEDLPVEDNVVCLFKSLMFTTNSVGPSTEP